MRSKFYVTQASLGKCHLFFIVYFWNTVCFDIFVKKKKKKKSTAICTKNLAWKFYSFCTHNTVQGQPVRRIENEISHEDDERQSGELRVRPFVFTGILFFFPGMKCIPGKKKLDNSKVDFCMNWRQIDDRLCEPILAKGTKSIDQSVSQSVCPTMSFCHRAIPENCAFARFRSPRLFMEAMQFTNNRLCTLVEKRYTRVYTHARTSPRDDAALIEFLDPRHSAWLFITRAIYLRVISLSRWRRRKWKRGTGKDEDFLCPFYSTNVVEFCEFVRGYTALRRSVRNFSYKIRKLSIADYPRAMAFIRWTSIRCK